MSRAGSGFSREVGTCEVGTCEVRTCEVGTCEADDEERPPVPPDTDDRS